MSTNRRVFAEDFTIYRVAELKPLLLESLQGHDRIELDLSGVEHMDSAGCQLLMLVKREASAAGKVLAIAAHSPAVQSLIEFYNLAAWFGDPLVVAAQEGRSHHG
ncbi:STAS domain-containing protein [Zoogloea sp.]|uniref:STAS domain-containing protein n=1 Tax=Zoogloea sp. TaxID=49181 RepID=UPI00260B619F|nr:STAS domain-containing protein [Zoogloea sp.]MDD3352362.1 STAS domain-containing protein [Zoogloea sp.]